MGGVMTKLIENEHDYSYKVGTFSTAADNQPSVEIHILQGSVQWQAITKPSADST